MAPRRLMRWVRSARSLHQQRRSSAVLWKNGRPGTRGGALPWCWCSCDHRHRSCHSNVWLRTSRRAGSCHWRHVTCCSTLRKEFAAAAPGRSLRFGDAGEALRKGAVKTHELLTGSPMGKPQAS